MAGRRKPPPPAVRDAQAVVAVRLRAAGATNRAVAAVLAVSESTARDRAVRGRTLPADRPQFIAALARVLATRGLVGLPAEAVRAFVDIAFRGPAEAAADSFTEQCRSLRAGIGGEEDW